MRSDLLVNKQLVHENMPTAGRLCLMSVRECLRCEKCFYVSSGWLKGFFPFLLT